MKLKRILIVAAIVLVPVVIFGISSHPKSHFVQHIKEYYQCSMHPWIISDKPGNCSICGMKLEKVAPTETSEANKGKGKIIYYQNPMNPKVTSPVPAKDEMGMDYVPVYESQANTKISVPGYSEIDLSPERRQMIGITKEKVEIRPMIYSIHSLGHVAYNPDIANVFGEYREALAAYKSGRWNRDDKVKEKSMQVLELAQAKLMLAGISKEQFEQIKNANYDTRGLSNYFAPVNLSLPEGHVWVDTDIFEPDSELVQVGNEVRMISPSLPGKAFTGTVKYMAPLLNEFPRKLRVRIDTESGETLKAAMALEVHIKVDLGQKLAIPETALIDSGNLQIVFVDHGEGHFEPRQVQVGQLADGFYEIVTGLKEGEEVVTSSTFLMDSESKLRAAAQGFSLTNSVANSKESKEMAS